MPILENTRHELFAQELAKGKSGAEAYVLAGFRPSRRNASRLRAKEDITARVHELQGASAESVAITVQSICAELDAAVAVARSKGQGQALVSAANLRAKLAGLLTGKIEVTTDLEYYKTTCDDIEQISAHMAYDLSGVKLTDEPLRDFTALVRGWFDAMQEFLAAYKAKPVQSVSTKSQIERVERKRLSLWRNGQS